MFYTYIIKNKEKNKIYIGQTSDIEKRLKRHNGILPSKASSYTKINKGNWELIYKEKYNTRGEAIRREIHLKSHQGRDWIRSTIMGR